MLFVKDAFNNIAECWSAEKYNVIDTFNLFVMYILLLIFSKSHNNDFKDAPRSFLLKIEIISSTSR